MMEDLIQSDDPHMDFTNEPSFHNLVTHIFTLNLNITHYLALHDLIYITENEDNTLHVK